MSDILYLAVRGTLGKRQHERSLYTLYGFILINLYYNHRSGLLNAILPEIKPRQLRLLLVPPLLGEDGGLDVVALHQPQSVIGI